MEEDRQEKPEDKKIKLDETKKAKYEMEIEKVKKVSAQIKIRGLKPLQKLIKSIKYKNPLKTD